MITLPPDVVAQLHAVRFEDLVDAWETIERERGGSPEIKAALNRADRYYLLVVTCGRADAFHPWVYERCREVEAAPDDRLDLWARESYKSTLITFAGSLQEILKDPEITIGIFSHTAPHAKKFLNQIKVELETNERLKEQHPEILYENPGRDAPKWSLDAGLCVKRSSNPKEQTVEAHGLVDGMPTGSHFQLRIYDDVVTPASVATPEQVQKTTAAWSLSDALGAARPGPDGRMLPGRKWTIGTRYTYHDTYQTMLEMKTLVPRIYPATDNGRRDGKPVLLSDEQWQSKLVNMLPSVLAAQMLQNPAAGNESMFQEAWVKYTDVRPKTINVYITVDPANSKKKGSDHTAMAVIGVDAGRNKYLLDGYDHKMSLTERWANLKNLYRRWANEPGVQLVRVGYERYGMQADLEYFEERMVIEKYHFPIEEVAWPLEGPGSKEDRIERLVPDFMQGKFRLIEAPQRYKEVNGERVLRPSANDPAAMGAYLSLRAIEHELETALQRRCREAGELFRILKLPMRRDHEGNIYSLTKNFLEQYLTFPFSQKKDFLDAASRIYDLDPQPPMIIDERMTEPEVYVDGV